MANNSVELFLDNYSNIYSPGQTVSGKVECVLTTDYFGTVKISYTGIAETKWMGEESYYDDYHEEEKTREVEYSDREVYFNTQLVLIEAGSNFRPEPGKHTYPFTYILPQHLPSSFEGTYGKIQYKIVATMDPPSIPGHESAKIINIVTPLDLNRFPHLRLQEPVERSLDTTPCSFWCQNSGPITFTLFLAGTGFVPGQEVNIGACVENLSNINVENVTFEIVAKIEYITPQKRNYEENDIAGIASSGAIGAHGEKSWTATLTIPRNRPIPNLIPCNIINVNYILRAELVLPFPHVNLSDELKVMIGTVPLSGVNTRYPVSPPIPNNSYAPTAPILIQDTSSNRSNDSPSRPRYGFSIEGVSKPTDPSQVPPYPGEMSSSSAPPTYDEAQRLKEKHGKFE